MKVTKIEGRKVKVIKGKLEERNLLPVYIMGEVTSIVKATKIIAKANGLHNADGVAAICYSKDVTADIDLKKLYEGE